MKTKQVVMTGIGGPEVLQVTEVDTRAPAPGEALVLVEASGVSFAEQQMRRGRYFAQPAFPFVPGYDMVGRVQAVGAGVTRIAEGARVAALLGTGGWTERIVLEADDLVLVPEGIPPREAAAVIVNGLTAWRMLHRLAAVKAGQTAVVFGASGGVGTLLVMLARLAGVRVIGMVTPPKTEAVRALGAEPLDYTAADLVRRVQALAPEGVDAVFDHRGGPGLRESWSMLRPGGTLVGYGVADYRDAAGDPMAPVYESMNILEELGRSDPKRRATFFNIWEGKDRDLAGYRIELRSDLTGLFSMIDEGQVSPAIAATYPFEQAADALRYAEGGKAVGKVILMP